MKRNCNIPVEEEPRYKISLKKGYRIVYIVMTGFFLVCALYFGCLSFCEDALTMALGLGFTGIFLIFLFYSLQGLTKKCERYKEKVVYSVFFQRREYALSDIRFTKEKVEEFYKDHGNGDMTSSWDRVTTFYNSQGETLFKFGLAYDNVPLLVNDVKKTQKSIAKQKKKK